MVNYSKESDYFPVKCIQIVPLQNQRIRSFLALSYATFQEKSSPF